MIYRANNEPLVLIEDAADAFLESVGVRLFEDEISIDGTLYEGSYGESILEENGIFLYEDGIVLEGQQAEEYKARKAKEKADTEEAEEARLKKSYKMDGSKGDFVRFYTPAGNQKHSGNSNYISVSKKDNERAKRTDEIFNKEIGKREKEYDKANTALHSHIFRKGDELYKTHPGVRPTGLFKRKEKREYDAKLDKYQNRKRELDERETQLADKANKARENVRRMDYKKHDIKRSINRHMRRHPEQYKESTIFSNIEII
jgi:hypothetical protein